ncbi:transcription factor HES-7 [Bombina bombina]|uniref:transcription factor HES-7 n=1 Tax=Bombina bombina TaxID=8345 RepID=UPI00235A807C|nr:transcription factor HES-7 [Bombina bombina]
MPYLETVDSLLSRKILKPVVEKQRRDRINRSLEEMRILLLRLTGNQKLRNPKMEKAEILELAVIYIRNLTQTKKHDKNIWVSPEEKFYISGFRDCLHRAEDFMGDISPNTRTQFLEKLHSHLEHTIRFPKQLNLCRHQGPEEDFSLSANDLNVSIDSPNSRDELRSCSPSSLQSSLLYSSDTGSPPGWFASTPQNNDGIHRDQDNTQTSVWRPWP